MWPFRRKADDRSSTLTSAAAPEPAPVPAHAWRDLPPLQRLTDDLTPVTEPDSFQDSLTTWKSPGLLEPLGHYVTPSAPSGVVHEVPTHSVRQFAEPPLVARMLSTRAPATIANPVVTVSPPSPSRPDAPTTIAMPTVSPLPPQAPRPASPRPVDHVLPIVDEPVVGRLPVEPSPSPEISAPEAETSAIAADHPHPTDESTDPEDAQHEDRSDVPDALATESTEVQRLGEAPLVGETVTSTPAVDAEPKHSAANGPAPKRIGLGLPISRSIDSPPPTTRHTGVLGQPRSEPPLISSTEVQHPTPESSLPAEASPQPIVQRSTSPLAAAADRGDEPLEETAGDADPIVDVSEVVHPTLGVDPVDEQPAAMAVTQPEPSPPVELPVAGPRAAVEHAPIASTEASRSEAEYVVPPLASTMPVASRQAEDRAPGVAPSGTPEMQLPEQPSASEVTAPLVGDPTTTISPTVQDEPRTTPVARADGDGLEWAHVHTEQPLGVPAAPVPVSPLTAPTSIQLERSPGDELSRHTTVEPRGFVPTLGVPATPDTPGPTPIVARASDATAVRLPSGPADVRPLSTLGDRDPILTPLTIASAAPPPAPVQRRVETPVSLPVLRTRLPMDLNYDTHGAATRPSADTAGWQSVSGNYFDSEVVVQRGLDESVVVQPTAFEGAGNVVDLGDDIGSDAAVQRDAGATAGGAASGGGAGGDLDELARKLYGRIRVHLRNELRLDRERSGSLVETRR